MRIAILSSAIVIASLCFLSHPHPSSSQENDGDTQWNYIPGSGKGPEDWWRLNKNWTVCKTGRRQSPIDFEDRWVDVVRHLGKLQTNYRAANAKLENRGHDISLSWVGGGGSLNIDGVDYILQECHWHSPAEHFINGQQYDMELHMVHQSSNGNVAVVGIVYKYGRKDPFLEKLAHPLEIISRENVNETAAGEVNPRLVIEECLEYYRYKGSLTTPPCTEGVIWTVLREPLGKRTVSRDQVKMLRNAVNADSRRNARPLQALNEREVLLNDPHRALEYDGISIFST